MTRRYDSFVIRCWHAGDQMLQVVVEHVQSGEQARGTSIEAAFDWLSVRVGLKPGPSSTTPAMPDSSGGSASLDIKRSTQQ